VKDKTLNECCNPADIIEIRELIERVDSLKVNSHTLSTYIGSIERIMLFYILYTEAGTKKLPTRCKKALAEAFTREYNGEEQLVFKLWLRQIMFLTHPKPRDDAQSEQFEALKQYEGE
jgi:hypothetical protein